MKFVFRDKGLGNYFTDEDKVKKLINTNEIKRFMKLPLVKVGDFVTCCHVTDSLNPTRNTSTYDNGSWKKDKVILVTNIILDHTYQIKGYSAPNYINTSGVRFSTEKEIEEFKKLNNLL